MQAGFYGLLLKSLGFDTEKLFYAIVVADRRARDDPNLKDNVFEAVMRNGLNETILSIENAVIYLTKFDEQEAESSSECAFSFGKEKDKPFQPQTGTNVEFVNMRKNAKS